jgi:predicted enzyme related to lactoylglutathione lyase
LLAGVLTAFIVEMSLLELAPGGRHETFEQVSPSNGCLGSNGLIDSHLRRVREEGGIIVSPPVEVCDEGFL